MMKRWNKVVLWLGLFMMFLGGLFYFYEKNPQVYNTLAEAGIEANILDSLGKWEGECSTGEYFSLVDKTGKEIDQTGRVVFVGDEVIVEDNNRYKVVRVDDKNRVAYCDLVGKENIAWEEEWDKVPVWELAQGNNRVGIYMTHTAESYVPTDNSDSKPGMGGIIQVGEALARQLQKNGVEAEISTNKHDPHDANAYHRSRKTAVQLLKTNPVVLLDVHRDGVPDPNFYRFNTGGEPATKVRLVVGRQNPRMSANLEFAKQIKAYFDKNNPGFIRGIFLAKGNYNQDLGPRAILLEIGTHTNSRTAAERGAALFADGLPRILAAATGIQPGPGAPGRAPSAGAGSALLWVLLIAIVGGAAFLLVSTGSLKDSVRKISELGKEFSNYFGPLKPKRKKDDK